jgi:hypothetical protein
VSLLGAQAQLPQARATANAIIKELLFFLLLRNCGLGSLRRLILTPRRPSALPHLGQPGRRPTAALTAPAREALETEDGFLNLLTLGP